MTYIQKKRIKLIVLGIGVLLLWIYLLGVMTAHASWVKIQDAEAEGINAFYYDNSTIDINKSTGVVKINLMVHFTPVGGLDFGTRNGLHINESVDLTYVVSVFEFNYKTSNWRILDTVVYNSNMLLIKEELIDKEEIPWEPKPQPGALAESWIKQIKKDYNL
jgi:hypothetical protein